MSNFSNQAMNYVPGPSLQQQPGLQSQQLMAANTMSYPTPILNPNPSTYSTTTVSSLPHPSTYTNPIMMPTLQTTNPSIPPNTSSYSSQPNPNVYPSHNSNPIQHAFPNQTDQPNVVPTQNNPPNSVGFPSPTELPHAASFPIPVTQPDPVPDPITKPATPPDPTPQPSSEMLASAPETAAKASAAPGIVPSSSGAPETLPTPSVVPETLPADNVALETSPTTSIEPETSPTPSSEPTTDTLPNPNVSLAGKLAENIRRSKRQRTVPTPADASTSEETPARPTKKAKTKSVPDSTKRAKTNSDTMESECPKEYLIENAYTNKLRFNNEIAKAVYRDDFARLSTKEEFQKYLSAQQKWRWELFNIVNNLDTRVHNLVANKNSGIAQNVVRYSTIPANCKSDDVRRCEKTAKELEKMTLRIEQIKEDMEARRSILFDAEGGVVAGEVDFIDEMLEKIDNLKSTVESFLSKVNDTLQDICRRFTTEAVEAAEVRRQKRRKKENLKKTKKRHERQQEKKVIDTMLRLTTKEVAERVLTGAGSAKIACDEINSKELNEMDSENDISALHTILVREYLDKDASKLVKNKLTKCK